MDELWRIELFGGLKLSGQNRSVTRFQTYKTGALLAYLCSHQQVIPRDMLVELLWPEAELDAARNSLRVALNSLRRQIEPPGIPTSSVLITNRSSVQLNRDVITTDVREFEAYLLRAAQEQDETQKETLLKAIACYQGPFLSGYYEDWITPERLRLSDAYAGALRRLTHLLVQTRELDRALDIARRALTVDPLHETSHCNLMQLYVALGKPAAAAQQYRDLEALLREQLGEAPSTHTQALARKLALNLGQTPTLRAEVTRPAAPAEAVSSARPPVSPVQTGYLPPQMTRFFGREAEMERLVAQLQSPRSRLITLTGPGGIGKTRLSLEVGERLRPTFQRRVWFVALAEVKERERFLGAIASALLLTLQPESDSLQQIIRTLALGPTLLILDNLEQVVDTGAEVVQTLLALAPELSILITSRQTLDIEGEREMPLSLLAVAPETDNLLSLAAVPSVQLFLDRAQAARADFQLTPRNAESIALLCLRLEGLPLAIELAAAWAQSLTPMQMLERLNTRFDLLVSSRKDRTPRQRTLRGTIDWSYHLLEPDLQALFGQLSVFQGGWTLDAAQHVCNAPQILTQLHQLQQRSLVITEAISDQVRFRLLSMLREYAAERLPEADRSALEEAHARTYFRVVRQAGPFLDRSGSVRTLRLLEADNENIHVALAWFVENGAWTEALEMGAVLWRFWYETAQVARGRYWIEKLCTHAEVMAVPSTGVVFYGAGRLAALQNDLYRADAYFRDALHRFQEQEDIERQTHALANLVLAAGARGDYEAVIACLTASLHLKRQGNSRWKLAYGLSALADAHLQHGDCRIAQSLFAESAALRKEIGDKQGCAEARLGQWQAIRLSSQSKTPAGSEAEAEAELQNLHELYALSAIFLNLGTMAWEQGDYRVATALLYDGLALFEESHDPAGRAFVLECLAEIALLKEDSVRAETLSMQSLQLRQEMEDTPGVIACLHLLGRIATARNDPFAAAAFFQEESRYRELPSI